MPEESTTPDLVELTRRAVEASNAGDIDAAMSFCAHDAVYDARRVGLRLEAVRRYPASLNSGGASTRR